MYVRYILKRVVLLVMEIFLSSFVPIRTLKSDKIINLYTNKFQSLHRLFTSALISSSFIPDSDSHFLRTGDTTSAVMRVGVSGSILGRYLTSSRPNRRHKSPRDKTSRMEPLALSSHRKRGLSRHFPQYWPSSPRHMLMRYHVCRVRKDDR